MPEITREQLEKMSLPEKVNQHAKDVMATENNPWFLRMRFQAIRGDQEEEHKADYPAGKDEYIYDFLLGKGSLGHPLKPTIVGEGVLKVAELVGTRVSFLDFTFANFEKRINVEAIARAFHPVWEMSAKLKALPQPADPSVIEQHLQQTRLALSRIRRTESKNDDLS